MTKLEIGSCDTCIYGGRTPNQPKDRKCKNPNLPMMFGKEFSPGKSPLETLKAHNMDTYIQVMGEEDTCHTPLSGHRRIKPLVMDDVEANIGAFIHRIKINIREGLRIVDPKFFNQRDDKPISKNDPHKLWGG